MQTQDSAVPQIAFAVTQLVSTITRSIPETEIQARLLERIGSELIKRSQKLLISKSLENFDTYPQN